MSTLYLVATPIGNLSDITFRAIETLKAVDIIACEDTRHSIVLLNHYEIKKPLISYHHYNEKVRSEELLKLLGEGKNVAIITDAGSPCISDPGAVIVKLAREGGYDVKIIPGASAVISAISLVGIDSGFTFLGFLPIKKSQRDELLLKYKISNLPIVIYSSPHDINNDAKTLYDNFGNREIYVVKELTKIYESVTLLNLMDFQIENPRGEYVLVVMPSTEEDPLIKLSIREHVETLIRDYDMTKKDAIKKVADIRGMNKNAIYQEVIDI